MFAASPPNSKAQPSNEESLSEKFPRVMTILLFLKAHLSYSFPSKITVVFLNEHSLNVAIGVPFVCFRLLIAVLTGTEGRASKRSLIVRFTVSGQAPCSGAERRDKELDEVSTAIPGGAAAWNVLFSGRVFCDPLKERVGLTYMIAVLINHRTIPLLLKQNRSLSFLLNH